MLFESLRLLLLHMLSVSSLLLPKRVLDIRPSLLLVNSTENKIHLLQGPALSLSNKDSHEDSHGGTEHTEHEEGSPPDLVNGVGCDLCDDKVE